MKPHRLLLVVLAIGFSSSSYALTTMGDRSCGKWVADQQNAIYRTGDTAWLSGLLSGMVIISGIDVLKVADGESILFWMDNYCKSHPLDLVGTGATTLFLELKQRMKE